MNCPKCNNKMVELFTSSVCDTCNPSTSDQIEVAAMKVAANMGEYDCKIVPLSWEVTQQESLPLPSEMDPHFIIDSVSSTLENYGAKLLSWGIDSNQIVNLRIVLPKAATYISLDLSKFDAYNALIGHFDCKHPNEAQANHQCDIETLDAKSIE